MFKNNKHTTRYLSIINVAASENRSKTTGYYERHHIIPKSLGGSNAPINLVLLTLREHYVVHLLLTLMCVDPEHAQKMNYAFWLMSSRLDRKNSRFYQRSKESAIDKLRSKKSQMTKTKMSEAAKKRPKITDETRLRMAIASSGREMTPAHKEKLRIANTGRIVSCETRTKISQAVKGKNLGQKRTPEQIARQVKGQLGRVQSEETRSKMSASTKGRECYWRKGADVSEETKNKTMRNKISKLVRFLTAECIDICDENIKNAKDKDILRPQHQISTALIEKYFHGFSKEDILRWNCP